MESSQTAAVIIALIALFWMVCIILCPDDEAIVVGHRSFNGLIVSHGHDYEYVAPETMCPIQRERMIRECETAPDEIVFKLDKKGNVASVKYGADAVAKFMAKMKKQAVDAVLIGEAEKMIITGKDAIKTVVVTSSQSGQGILDSAQDTVLKVVKMIGGAGVIVGAESNPDKRVEVMNAHVNTIAAGVITPEQQKILENIRIETERRAKEVELEKKLADNKALSDAAANERRQNMAAAAQQPKTAISLSKIAASLKNLLKFKAAVKPTPPGAPVAPILPPGTPILPPGTPLVA